MNMRHCLFCLVIFAFSVNPAWPADAASAAPANVIAPSGKTAGGKQVWSDQLLFRGWHIQKHAFTGHCRLLDPQDRRYASGTFDRCAARLEEIKRQQQLAPMRGKIVLVLHGILANRLTVTPICECLQNTGDFTVLPVGYASTFDSIGEHARNLDRIVRGLDAADEIHFVAHSLGNLVLRHYLADQCDPATGRKPDPRIKRIVMIAPPNQGAHLAHRFGDKRLFKILWGVPGQEIADWERLAPKLATPHCEFAILAGSKNIKKVKNPLVPGDDDLVLSVAETKLPGARDFAVLPLSHNEIRRSPVALDYTLRFLREGHFVASDRRHSLPAPPEPPLGE
jgi:pimeloyl-ACP methyl ester carboxylesterase